MSTETVPTTTTFGEVDSLLDEHKASRYLVLSVKTLRNWRSAGKGPRYVKIGRIVRYRRRDLDDFVEENLVETGT